MNMNIKSVARLSALLMLAVVMVSVAQPVTQEQAQREIELILNLPHGLYRLSPDDKALMARIKSNPAQHLQVLEQRYVQSHIRALKRSDMAAMQFERAIQLLGYVADNQAMQLLGQWYNEIDQWLIEDDANDYALILRRTVLNSLPNIKYQPIIDRTLTEYERLDPATAIALSNYLVRSGRGDQALITKVRSAQTNTKLSLHQTRQLQRLLQALER